jgi:hypothetical protein
MDTIAKIIDSERIWSDPDMADFDTGEREDNGTRVPKKAKKDPKEIQDPAFADEEQKAASQDDLDLEGDSEKENTELINTSSSRFAGSSEPVMRVTRARGGTIDI